MTLERRILSILDEHGINYELFKHEPVYTNPAMAEALKVTEAETVKSLVLTTGEGAMIVMVMPGDRRADWKQVARAAGTKKVSFAKPGAVLEKVGCEVGCVPPFGHFTQLPIFMDPLLRRQKEIYFNPGVHDKSVRLPMEKLERLCQPVFLDN